MLTLSQTLRALAIQVATLAKDVSALTTRITAVGTELSRIDRIYSTGDTTPPAVPGPLTAIPLSGVQILVSWLPVTDPSGVTYAVERTSGTVYSQVSAQTATSYTDTVPRGSTWNYRVRAFDGASPPNISGYTNVATATTPANTAPSFAPALAAFTVAPTASVGTVVADIGSYASDAENDPITVSMTGTLPAGLSYDPATKRVTVTGALTPAEVKTVSFTPDDGYLGGLQQVTGLVVVSTSSSSISIRWNDQTSEDGYYVERSTDGTTGWTRIATIPVNIVVYNDTGLPSGVSWYYRVQAYNSVTAGAYSAVVMGATSIPATGALADWQARSQAPGVLWYASFKDAQDPGIYWGLASGNFTNNRRTGYLNTTSPQTGPDGLVRSRGGVIPGWGCLEQYTPANVVIGNNSWCRPIGPTTGVLPQPERGYTPDPTHPVTIGGDINNPGWDKLEYKNANGADGYNKIEGMGGHKICNPSDLATYQRTIPAVSGRHPAFQEIVKAPVDGFYIQYRLKFPQFSNGDCLLDYYQDAAGDTTKPWRGAWQGKSWLCWSIGESDYFHEVGMMFKGYSPDPTVRPSAAGAGTQYAMHFAPLIYGRLEAWQYGNTPQTTGYSTTQIEGDYSTACNYQVNPGACWQPFRERWITFLFHLIPGSQNVDDHDDVAKWLRGDYGPLNHDQTVELWVADEGATQYTKLLTADQYAVFFSGRYALNGQTKTTFGFGDQFFQASNSGGHLLITPETNCAGMFDGCEMQFAKGHNVDANTPPGNPDSLPMGIPNSTKLYITMIGTTAFKISLTRANQAAAIYLPYINSGYDVQDGTGQRNRLGFSCAPGYSKWQILQQMNLTGSNSPYGKPSWVCYDQIICSTQFIPCPTV